MRVTGGVAGSVAVTVKVALAVAPALSFTVTVTVELPGAVGVPGDSVPPVPLEMLDRRQTGYARSCKAAFLPSP